MAANKTTTRITIKTTLATTEEPVSLTVVGSAKIGDQEITRAAVPAEDQMQAFLWRHLVPASDLKALVYNPSSRPPPKRPLPVCPPANAATKATEASSKPAAKAKFSKQQVASRLRQLKWLYEEGLLTDGFYIEKVVECEAGQ